MRTESAGLIDAIRLAQDLHAGQMDRRGAPYTEHLARVACHARTLIAGRNLPDLTTIWIEQVAWLHDVLEDAPTTPAELIAQGFSPVVVASIERVTRPAAGNYQSWIEGIARAGDSAALVVKLADLADHLDPSRADGLTPSLRARYERATATLRAAYFGPEG